MRFTTPELRLEICLLFSVLLPVLLACGSPDSPESVAEYFLQCYLVEINQTKALEVSESLAAKKLKDELYDVQAIRASGVDITEGKPTIRFALLEKRERTTGRWMLLYRVDVMVEKDQTIRQGMLVTVSGADENWKVTNFQYVRKNAADAFE